MFARMLSRAASAVSTLLLLACRISLQLFRTAHELVAGSHRRSAEPLRISKPLSAIRDSYDVVVIGSGYGGGVAASRTARSQPKQSVCVLERGLERWPGEYPDSGLSVLRALQVVGYLDLAWLKSIAVRLGDPTGLYRWMCVGSSNAFVGSDFDRAEATIEPQSCPGDRDLIYKHAVLEAQARKAGVGKSFASVKQTIAFADRVNATGVRMKRSTFSGQDSVGLNDGSKNTVLATYLADAWCFGAEIFCGCEVRYVKKHPRIGWLIYFRSTGDSRSWPWSGRSPAPDRWVHAKKLVFLAAGSLGSTEIVLRSRAHGLPVSPMVGKGFNGNGGFLGFGYGLSAQVNAIGQRSPKCVPPGPTVSAMIDRRVHDDFEQDYLVQDGTFPPVMLGFFRLVKVLLHRRSPERHGILEMLHRLIDLLNPFSSAMQRTQVYLVQSHDNANGEMTLRDDLPVLDVRNIDRKSNLTCIKTLLAKMTHALDGILIEQGFKVVVHILGGLGMAGDGTGRTGSTSHVGELLTGIGIESHAGLYVVDGAVVPRSLGANPFATITALAERSVDSAAQRLGCTIDLDARADFDRTWKMQLGRRPSELSFSETMAGYIVSSGTRSLITLRAYITVERTTAGFEGLIYGTVECLKMSAEPLVIRQGTFKPFIKDSAQPDQMIMAYDFTAIDSSGHAFDFRCRKVFNPSVGLSIRRLWVASTTMTFDSTSQEGAMSARGELGIDLLGVLNMIASMRPVAGDQTERSKIMASFVGFFVTQLSFVFVPRIAPLKYPAAAQYNGSARGELTRMEM